MAPGGAAQPGDACGPPPRPGLSLLPGGRAEPGTTAPPQDLAAFLRGWRATAGLSRQSAAAALGVARGTLGHWERGVVPTLESQRLLGEHFGWSPEVREQLFARPDTGGGRRNPLRTARLAAGMSGRQLAATLHVAATTLSDWECGTKPVDPVYLPRLAEVLALTPLQAGRLAALSSASRFNATPLPGLAARRRRAGLTQRDLADRLGISVATVHQWEKGQPVHRQRLAAVIAALGTGRGEADGEALLCAARPVPAPRSAPSRLQRARELAGKTRAEAAAAAGTTPRTLARLELGRRRPTLWLLLRLADCYGIPPAVLCRAAGTALPQELDRTTWAPGDLPKVLSTLRHSAGRPVAVEARAVSVSERTLRHWESGRTVPDPQQCATLERHWRLHRGELARLRTRPGARTDRTPG